MTDEQQRRHDAAKLLLLFYHRLCNISGVAKCTVNFSAKPCWKLQTSISPSTRIASYTGFRSGPCNVSLTATLQESWLDTALKMDPFAVSWGRIPLGLIDISHRLPNSYPDGTTAALHHYAARTPRSMVQMETYRLIFIHKGPHTYEHELPMLKRPHLTTRHCLQNALKQALPLFERTIADGVARRFRLPR